MLGSFLKTWVDGTSHVTCKEVKAPLDSNIEAGGREVFFLE